MFFGPVGDKIRELRVSRGLTQKALGLAMGFPEKSADVRIRHFESGRTLPKWDEISRLSDVLEVDPSCFSALNINSDEDILHALFEIADFKDFLMDIDIIDDNVHVIFKKNSTYLYSLLYDWYLQRQQRGIGISNKSYSPVKGLIHPQDNQLSKNEVVFLMTNTSSIYPNFMAYGKDIWETLEANLSDTQLEDYMLWEGCAAKAYNETGQKKMVQLKDYYYPIISALKTKKKKYTTAEIQDLLFALVDESKDISFGLDYKDGTNVGNFKTFIPFNLLFQSKSSFDQSVALFLHIAEEVFAASSKTYDPFGFMKFPPLGYALEITLTDCPDAVKIYFDICNYKYQKYK